MKVAAYYRDVLVPGNCAVSQLRRNGLSISRDRIAASMRKWDAECAVLEEQVREWGSKRGLDLKFSKAHRLGDVQMFDVLYGPKGLALPVTEYTDTGKASTAAGALMQYASLMNPRPDDDPTVRALLKLRALNKAASTYAVGYSKFIRPDGCLHPGFSWALRTARLSAERPNTQNITERADRSIADEIKSWFLPRIAPAPSPEEWDPRIHGSVWRWDISGAEAVIRIACIATRLGFKDEMAYEYLRRGKDIHSKTACLIFGKPDGTFKKGDIERDGVGKNTTFAKIYGAKWNTVQRTVWHKARHWLSDEEAQAISDAWEVAYPGVMDLYEQYDKVQVAEFGYVEDGYGRRRHIDLPQGVTYGGLGADGRTVWHFPRNMGREEYGLARWKLNNAFHMAANCLDAETEALTQRGWVRGFDLSRDDVLLTKNAVTGALEWQRMLDLKLWPDYEGPLVEFKSKSFHAISTPEHRWLVRDRRKAGDVEATTETLNPHGFHGIHLTGRYENAAEGPLSPDEAEVMGWWLTDGYIKRRAGAQKTTRGRTYQKPRPVAYIVQSVSANPVKCRRIDALLARVAPGEFRKYVRAARRRDTGAPYTKAEWSIGPSTASKLMGLCPDRALRADLLYTLSRSALDRLKESMILGDGCVEKGRKTTFVSGVREQAEAFQILCTLTGTSASIKWRDLRKYSGKSSSWNSSSSPGIWTVTELRRKHAQVLHKQRRTFTARQPVWCPVVPNTFFVARRSGTVFVTGNTPTQSMNASDCIWMLALTSLGEYVPLALPPIWRDQGLMFPEAAGWTLNEGPGPGGEPLQSWYTNTVHDSGWGDCAPGRHLESTGKVVWRRCQALPMDWRIETDTPYRIEFKVGPDQAHLMDYNKCAAKFGFAPLLEYDSSR